MKNENDQIPLALRQVWDWKAAVWEDLKDVPFAEAAATVAKRAHKSTRDLGFQTVTSPPKTLSVAEKSAKYGNASDETPLELMGDESENE